MSVSMILEQTTLFFTFEFLCGYLWNSYYTKLAKNTQNSQS